MFTLTVPVTATTMSVTSGTLRSQKIRWSERASFASKRRATFTATHKEVARTMVLRAGASQRVTIGNQGMSAIDGKAALAENHFLAFHSLTEDEVSCSLPVDDEQVQTTIACSNSRYP
ncbi:MAG TPA: hypothetical protein VGQ76_02715 [Thermoanaerobaculia bacterium]|jgi:hypothetical protein|nr:hypothetical protein [Thermoanaerobaculia bacterium]